MINEEVTFLANVLHMAHADGKLSANEQAMIETVRKEFGFKKSDLSAASKLGVILGTQYIIDSGN